MGIFVSKYDVKASSKFEIYHQGFVSGNIFASPKKFPNRCHRLRQGKRREVSAKER